MLPENSANDALEAIYASAPVGLAVISADGRYLRINKRLADINGYSVECHIGRTLEDIVPSIADQIRAVIDEVVRTGVGVFDAKITGDTSSAPGVMRVWREQWSPIKDAGGATVALNVVVEDITEQEHSASRIRESAAFTRRVLDNLFAFVGVLNLDGTLVEANRAPLDMAGLSWDDVLGRKFWDCHWWSHSPLEQQRLRESFLRCLAGETVRYDVEVRARGDSRIWIDFQMAPLRDDNGQITHIIPSGSDIQARLEAESMLRLQKAEVESLLQSAPIGLAFFDRDHRYVRINNELADINGVPVADHIGRSIADVLPINARFVIPLIDKVFETGEPIRNLEVEGETPRAPGVRRHWLAGFYPVTAADGAVVAVGAWVVEITDRKQSEEKIRLLMREVNHRSKNILSVVQAIANQTLATGDPHDAADRFSARLQGVAASHDLLVNNAWKGVHLSALIKSQLAHFADLLGARIQYAGPDLLISPAAAQTIGMALHELVTNAAKYGALSNGTGGVHLRWAVTQHADDAVFTFEWEENGGPTVSPPVETGFGSLLLSRLTALGLSGHSSISYPESGVRWMLEAPFQQLVTWDTAE